MKILSVPYISQKDRYPTGCESVSTVMLLHYLGIHISVDDFIHNYLECRPFEIKDGQLYGADPREHFCGSPYSADDYGCYAPVICKALNRLFADTTDTTDNAHIGGTKKYQPFPASTPYIAIDESGKPTELLLREYIDHDMPVIYWACIDMKEPILGPDWTLFESKEKFTWISNEHCLLLVGYDEEKYYFNDPYEGHGLIGYPRAMVEARHKAQYCMAVGVKSILPPIKTTHKNEKLTSDKRIF